MTNQVNTQFQNSTETPLSQHINNDSLLFAQAVGSKIPSVMPARFEDRFGTQYQDFGVISPEGMAAGEKVYGFKPWLNENGKTVKGALDFGDAKDLGKVYSDGKNTPLSQIGGVSALGDDNKTYSFINSQAFSVDEKMFGFKPGEYVQLSGEQEAFHEMYKANFGPQNMVVGPDGKPRFSDDFMLKDEIVQDAVSIATNNKYNQVLLSQYVQSALNPSSVSGNYAATLKVTGAALDKLADKYNIEDQGNDQNGNPVKITRAYALLAKFTDYHQANGGFGLDDLREKGIKEFAKNSLKVDPDQFYDDFNQIMQEQYLTTSREIIAKEQEKKARASL